MTVICEKCGKLFENRQMRALCDECTDEIIDSTMECFLCGKVLKPIARSDAANYWHMGRAKRMCRSCAQLRLDKRKEIPLSGTVRPQEDRAEKEVEALYRNPPRGVLPNLIGCGWLVKCFGKTYGQLSDMAQRYGSFRELVDALREEKKTALSSGREGTSQL